MKDVNVWMLHCLNAVTSVTDTDYQPNWVLCRPTSKEQIRTISTQLGVV